MARKNEDRFANIANVQVDVDNATYNFTELLTGISLQMGMGILIDKIEYQLSSAALLDLDADGDGIQFAWCTSNTLTSIDMDKKGVIHQGYVLRADAGTAGDHWVHEQPYTFEFTPAIIVAAPRLYLGSLGIGAVSEGILRSRLYFRYINLTAQEYLEIAETFVLVG